MWTTPGRRGRRRRRRCRRHRALPRCIKNRTKTGFCLLHAATAATGLARAAGEQRHKHAHGARARKRRSGRTGHDGIAMGGDKEQATRRNKVGGVIRTTKGGGMRRQTSVAAATAEK